MNRIKGHYICLGERRERWLDTATGALYESQNSTAAVAQGFKLGVNTGEWWWGRDRQFHFIPDLVAQDWYVLRHVPAGMFCGEPRPASTQCLGPFVENVARTKAVVAVKTHRGPDCKVSVVQIKQGDTYSKVTPATPEPTYNWS